MMKQIDVQALYLVVETADENFALAKMQNLVYNRFYENVYS